ncbi:putative aldo-keto reductase [Xylariaceae sp. FL1272]|nr:putative aldo-keto reductase [Xylariaceae sp. FL1272]
MATQSTVRRLGKNGPNVAALGFGMIALSAGHYGSLPSNEESLEILSRAHALGYTFWDSADLYGDNEELIGQWLKKTGKRDEVFIATKFGFVKDSKTYEVNSSAPYCKKCCAESLARLNVDYIDLYYLHHPNPDTPIEETMRALKELQDEGKIKHIGLSSISSASLRRACKIAPVAACQVDYSVFMRDVEGPTGDNLIATCRELGIAVVAAMPLGRGMVTSSFGNNESSEDPQDTRSKAMPRFQEANREHNAKIVATFKSFADKKGCTVSQLALAWLLKQGDDIIPIPGTKRLKYVEENWAATSIILTDQEEKEIRAFLEGNEMAGGVVPPGMEHYYYRDTKEEA